MTRPVVAIVGRPNVGKSTLFNRLIGERKAIVEDAPGVTRDRLYEISEWAGHEFVVIDTGGIRFSEREMLAKEVRMQAEMAISEADVIVFAVDAQQGIVLEDEQVADLLRKTSKPVVLAVNKVDDWHQPLTYYEFFALGLGDPIPVSAIHGANINDLLDAVVAHFSAVVLPLTEEDAVKIALVGRPNVGKSSIVNALLGEQRVIVSEIAGTTRDAIDTKFIYNGLSYVLIDTAGIRRKSRINVLAEKYSVIRSLRSMERADVVLLILNAAEGIMEQDKRVAGYIQKSYKANIIVFNKWDLVDKDTHTINTFKQELQHELKFLHYSPNIFVSAATGQRLGKLLSLVDQVAAESKRRIGTGDLNQVIREAVLLNPLPGAGKKRGKIYYATQVAIAPPAFVFFVNDLELIHFTYKRYLDNVLRTNYGFEGVPLRLIFRQRSEQGDE